MLLAIVIHTYEKITKKNQRQIQSQAFDRILTKRFVQSARLWLDLVLFRSPI